MQALTVYTSGIHIVVIVLTAVVQMLVVSRRLSGRFCVLVSVNCVPSHRESCQRW
jgi:hypothetical protein